jgi:glutamate synthase (NADPH/NADH) large chain
MTGGVVYVLDVDETTLDRRYVKASALDAADAEAVRALLMEHTAETASPSAEALLASFDPARFSRVGTCVMPEPLE